MRIIDTSDMYRSHHRFLEAHDREISQALERSGDVAVKHVRHMSEFKRRSATGSAKDRAKSKLVRLKSGYIVRISHSKTVRGASLSHILEHGSRPHAIVARRAKFLRFRGRDGKFVFRKRVWHPGTRAYRFLWKATQHAYRYANSDLQKATLRAAKKF